MRRVFIGALVVAALSGCSQVAAIAPVGGSHIAEVRFAALDVLVQQDVDVKTAPVCEIDDDRTVTCLGETLTGKTITVTSPGTDETILTVQVGTETLYDGHIMDVINSAVRP